MLISDDELREELIPPPFAPWRVINQFALTYDGYREWGHPVVIGRLASKCREAWDRERRLPDSLGELRACLFCEQRYWHHFGDDPDYETLQYIWALVEKIRDVVKNRPRPPLQ